MDNMTLGEMIQQAWTWCMNRTLADLITFMWIVGPLAISALIVRWHIKSDGY